MSQRILKRLILSAFCLAPALFSGTALAAESSINVSVSSSDIVIDMDSPSPSGTFKKSDSSTVSISTDNYTGYTFSISAVSDTNSSYLINDQDSNSKFTSISEATTEAEFKAFSGTSYNGLWGYLPSKLNSTSNTDFLPAPSTTGDLIDKTSAPNATANNYDIAIGARADFTMKVGDYSNHYALLVVANAIPYTIIYKDNVVGNMPVDVDTTSMTTDINISSNTPTRTGYTFLGWCTVQPTTSNGSDTCTGGTTYGAGDIYTLDQTGANNIELWAMWQHNYTIGDLVYMQDFAKLTPSEKTQVLNSMVEDQQYQLTDIRDSNKYYIAKLKDGKIWMTQNLDYVITSEGLNSETSDLNAYGSGIYSNGYSYSNGVISWAPNSTAYALPIMNHSSNTVPGWSNSDSAPHQAEGGDTYYTGTRYTSRTACLNAGFSEEQCSHYHLGNYYNWTAAIASNGSGSLTTNYMPAENSICPAGWRLSNGLVRSGGSVIISEWNNMLRQEGIANGTSTSASANVGWASGGYSKISNAPTYLIRGGHITETNLSFFGQYGHYWTSTVIDSGSAYDLSFYSDELQPARSVRRYYGWFVRCVAR